MRGLRLASEWRAFLMAVQFLTRVPIPAAPENSDWRADLQRSPRYFPLVGSLVGLATGCAFALLSLLLPPLLAAALALALEALITGAFHEDAFADYCDAIGGGMSREQTLEILKDSRIGSYGATGLILGLLIRASALAALPAIGAIAASAGAGALGRLSAVFAMSMAPPLPRASLVKDVGAMPGRADLTFALLSGAPGIISMMAVYPYAVIIAALAALAITRLLVSQMMRRTGGIFGDGLGAITFIVQCSALIACAAQVGGSVKS